MYAKVLKKRKYEPDWCSSKDSVFSTDHDSTSSSFHSGPIVDHVKNNDDDKNRDNDDRNVDEVDGIGMNGCYETLPDRK